MESLLEAEYLAQEASTESLLEAECLVQVGKEGLPRVQVGALLQVQRAG